VEKPAIEAAPAAKEPVVRTAIVGFQAIGHAARLQSNWHPHGDSSGWYTICIAPCTRQVPVDATLRAAGASFDPSRPFHVPSDTDRVIFTSTLKHKSLALPAGLIAGGYGSMALGPLVFIAGYARAISNQPGGDALLVTGLGLFVSGAIVGTVGVLMLIAKAGEKESSVSVAEGASPRLKLPGGLALESRGFTF
jgi:hypothetical protein